MKTLRVNQTNQANQLTNQQTSMTCNTTLMCASDSTDYVLSF